MINGPQQNLQYRHRASRFIATDVSVSQSQIPRFVGRHRYGLEIDRDFDSDLMDRVGVSYVVIWRVGDCEV